LGLGPCRQFEFDSDILYQDLLFSRAGKEFNSPGLTPAVE